MLISSITLPGMPHLVGVIALIFIPAVEEPYILIRLL